MAPASKSNADRSLQLMAVCLPAALSTASHLLRPPKLARSKLATFHKQFHQLVTQLDVYWKMTDFPGASRVPALGDGALAHIIDHNYDLSLVSFATLFMETIHWGFLLLFILIWSQACLLNLRPLLFALHLLPFHCQQPIRCIASIFFSSGIYFKVPLVWILLIQNRIQTPFIS